MACGIHRGLPGMEGPCFCWLRIQDRRWHRACCGGAGVGSIGEVYLGLLPVGLGWPWVINKRSMESPAPALNLLSYAPLFLGRCRRGRTGRIRNPLTPQGVPGFKSLSPRQVRSGSKVFADALSSKTLKVHSIKALAGRPGLFCVWAGQMPARA